MSAALWLAVALLLAGAAAGSWLVLSSLVRGLRDESRRFDADRRRRGAVAGIAVAILLVPALVLMVVEPWGRRTVVYVILGYAAACVAVALAGVAIERSRDGRTVLFVLTGIGSPLVFAGLAGLLNGYTVAGTALIVVSAVCFPIWLRLRRGLR
jgi:hypothetical protein